MQRIIQRLCLSLIALIALSACGGSGSFSNNSNNVVLGNLAFLKVLLLLRMVVQES